MLKKLLPLLLFFLSINLVAQTEKLPVFKNCDSTTIQQLSNCFKSEVRKRVKVEFKLPQELQEDNFKAELNIVFLVNDEGKFKVIYVNSPYKELKDEIIRVFETFPIIEPGKFNNHAIEMQFVYPLKIPFTEEVYEEIEVKEEQFVESSKKEQIKEELKSVTKTTLFPEHQSELVIPFSHSTYNELDFYLDQADNTHTGMKPYVYNEVKPYVNLDNKKSKLLKPKSTWFGRKLLNEHMAFVKGKDYWFTVNPVVDLQIGKDSEDVETFNNTRAIQIQGGLGKNLNFSTSFYESQGRYAIYVNDYAELMAPAGGNPAVIPGRGIAKEFKTDAYDFPVTEAYLSYTPNNHFNFQFGKGKNFIGDGYRSLVLSDVASPYTFFKVNTQFWKIKYTNLWMWMQDVRPELTVDGAYKRKFMATHFLSLNITKKLNVGLFETIIWDTANDGGFNAEYLNPLIFYTAAEFSGGSRAGNALLGFTLKYKLKNISLYSQVLIDELRVSEITSSDGWWGNKNGIQIGAKMFNAFGVENLFIQAEYNQARPYTYSHDELNYNFGHTNQPLAHLWGSNFREFVGVVSYKKDRWFANAKVVAGSKGFDYNNESDSFSYGGNIFADNDNRISEYGNEITQGNKADIFIGNVEVGYLINPATNLKLFGSVMVRDFKSEAPINGFENLNSTWFSVGVKTDVFNWYFDY